MSKKKKKGGSIKTLSPAALEQKVLNVLQNDLKGRYNAKDVKKLIAVENNSDAIEHALEQLLQRGLLIKVANGQKYKYNRNVEQSAPGQSEGPLNAYKKPEKTRDEGEKKAESSSKGTATGILDPTRSGSAYVVSDDSGLQSDIFIPQGRLANALKGDRVKVRWYLSRRGKPEGEVLEIVTRHREAFIGTMVLSKQFCFVSPDDDSIPVDILVSRKKTMDAQNGDKVVVKIIEWHPKHGVGNPVGEITTVLGQSGSSDIEMKSILIKHGFELEFNSAVNRENDAIPTVILPSEINLRRDLRDVTTFTIDPETAKDFDDAISIQLLKNGNYEIGVHIADVTHYVREGSALDKEAAKRTTSVYLVDRVLPMLPEKLSNGVCSLRPHEDKLTFSAVFEFTQEGEIVNEWYGKTVIHSDRRFTYEEAQDILNGKEGDFAEELKTLNRYAHILRKARFKKGSINFESPEIRFKLDENGKPLEAYVKERMDTHQLVEDFMLLANKMVAQQIMAKFRQGGPQIPFVYRVHDLPDMDKVQNFANFASRLGYPMNIKSVESVYSAFNKLLKDSAGKNEQGVLQQLGIRTMAKAAYSTNNIGHFGLAFVDYTHFTSPIRRYADVLVHRAFEEFLEDKTAKMNPAKLEELCKHISRRERNAMEAERESVKYKQAEYLLDHVGGVFEAFISGMTEFGIYGEIKQNFCEGMIRYENMYDSFTLQEDGFHIKSPSMTYKMGDTIWVRIQRVDLAKRQVDLAMITEADAFAELAAGKEAKAAEPVIVPVLPELPKHKSKELIYDEIEIAYEKSDIHNFALQNAKEWYYQLSETPDFKDSLMLLGFNPKADADKRYLAQTHLPENDLNKEVWKKAIPLLETHFSEYPLDKISDTYFCPFRSEQEGQISKKDLELCLPIFQNRLKGAEPKLILSFSSRLRDHFIQHKLLSGIQELEQELGKRKIKTVKGQLKNGRKKVTIIFMPSLGTILSNELKKELWSWAAKK
jgi:ribonuclease R